MKSISGRNINDVFISGITLLELEGMPQHSQYDAKLGVTLEIPGAASIEYRKPCERVLFDPVRDGNPFLGFFEALWIIMGRDDVAFLKGIVDSMGQYSDDGHRYYGAYGKRLRFGAPGTATGAPRNTDQIYEAIQRLKRNQDDRQVVMLIRAADDMWYQGKDQPCNYAVDLKVRNGQLNMAVLNRSNDFVWGMCGTNVVQFSTLLEYMAGMIGVNVGVYHQISTSMHVYQNAQWDKIRGQVGKFYDPYTEGLDPVYPYPMMKGDTEAWHRDLHRFFWAYDRGIIDKQEFHSPYFKDVVIPMWNTLQAWKHYQKNRNMDTFIATCEAKNSIKASDWKLNVAQWLTRREYKY